MVGEDFLILVCAERVSDGMMKYTLEAGQAGCESVAWLDNVAETVWAVLGASVADFRYAPIDWR